ncbi:bifunctional metallophosphatase/5'-nucleotidase [Pseudomonas putida]|uniref:bifunctional metallophosphatase/5'-nucleotidase n=1 Tax=Pseudomonas putida TaxID=303 RepID=UPI0023655A48|nr:bifunctional metallophosphatase/5'-nucleotidase [Pseudomonas putida]MDD2047892.1 bifunctional metallophosphatase/5'-nucleotidase [Pseudomonas putida]
MINTLFRNCALATMLSLQTLPGANLALADTSATVRINIAAINDLHGNLHPTPLTYKDAEGKTHRLDAGGIATLGGMLDELRTQDPNLLVVGAGDLIGASPAASSMWADEPVIEALRGLGLNLSSAGNHELDAGKAELLRKVNGGCESKLTGKACQFRSTYTGTGFPYLAANLIDRESGGLLLPAYHIEQIKGVKIAFVGAVPADLSAHVTPQGIAGLEVISEAEGINRVIPEIKAQGVNAIVAVVHQGGHTSEAFDEANCSKLRGDITEVARLLDPAVDALISGHTHQAYQCKIGNLHVTQSGDYGHFITHLTLDLTPGQHRVTHVTARNLLADPTHYQPNASLARLASEVQARSLEKLAQPIARIGVASLLRTPNADGESPMGNLIADAQLAATLQQNARIAFTNLRGIRTDLHQYHDQPLTFAQLFAAQPFDNSLIVMDLTAAQLQSLLNQQWNGDEFTSLQVSAGFHYRWDPKRPTESRVVPGSLSLDGKPLELDKTYRVTTNAFLAYGGNNFSTFLEGTRQVDSGIADVDALINHLRLSEERAISVANQGPARISREQ